MASSNQISADEPESPPRLQLVFRSKRLNEMRHAAPKKLACSEGKSHPGTAGSSLEERDNCEVGNRACWRFFPADIQDNILTKLEYKYLFQTKAVSKIFKTRIDSDEFHGWRGKMHLREGLLTALHFSVRGDHGVWQCAGYDLMWRSWKKLPPFHMLPRLDPALFKDHSICGAGGIMCANVSTASSTREKIIVFNPLTGRWKELPPLNHSRNPVLMQMVVDKPGRSYKIIVAGSAGAIREHLSKVTEVFDSRTSIWTIAEDVPGPLFALNEHQTGVYLNGVLYCIALLEGEDAGKGAMAFSVDEGKWLPHLSCPLPNPSNLNIVQLVESNGEMVLFSEIEHNPYNRSVEHRIDILEEVVITSSGQGRGKWRNVMSETKVGSQAGLQVTRSICVPFGEQELCIFNTIVHTGAVYDMRSGSHIANLPSPTWSGSGEIGFYSMNNPLTFSFEPSYKCNPESSWLQLPDNLADGTVSHVELSARTGPR